MLCPDASLHFGPPTTARHGHEINQKGLKAVGEMMAALGVLMLEGTPQS
jgi:hypothetical protein